MTRAKSAKKRDAGYPQGLRGRTGKTNCRPEYWKLEDVEWAALKGKEREGKDNKTSKVPSRQLQSARGEDMEGVKRGGVSGRAERQREGARRAAAWPEKWAQQ